MTRAPLACRAAAPALALLLCLLAPAAPSVVPSAAQSPAQPQQQSPAPSPQGAAAQPPSLDLPVKLNVIVTDESGRAAADVRPEEISVTEDGRPQTVTRFAREELPVSYGLVIDNSRSLAAQISSVIRAGERIAGGNRPGDETFVMRFVDSDRLEIFQDFTPDFEPVRDALSQLYPEGGQTAVIDALMLAVKHAAERRGATAGRRHALVLISDCEDRASVYKRDELVDLLRRANVQVFVIALPGQLQSPPDRVKKLAETVAAESGGRAFFVKKRGDAELLAAVDEVSRNLRSQYALEFRPTNAAPDGKFRRIEVTAAGKRKVHARPGYFGSVVAPRPLPAKK